MAKLKEIPIAEADIEEYLNQCSDFAFELRVQQKVIGEGFRCDHGGTYDDPVTKKPRQFDLRAFRSVASCDAYLALECKNLQPNFPLLISCAPRLPEESFHEVMVVMEPDFGPFHRPRADPIRLTGVDSVYASASPVGKASDRVGRNEREEFLSGDSELYERWAQAISSAHELIERVHVTQIDRNEMRFAFVQPILVVPDGCLWTVMYDALGTRVGPPSKSERCSFFIGKTYSQNLGLHWMNYTVSHMEFVTISGLPGLLREMFSSGPARDGVFRMDAVKEIVCGSDHDQ